METHVRTGWSRDETAQLCTITGSILKSTCKHDCVMSRNKPQIVHGTYMLSTPQIIPLETR